MMIGRFLFVLVSLKHIYALTFQPVTETCKYWDPVSILRNGENVRLHCILDENYQLGIVNTTWQLIEKGQCPFFNRHTRQIDSFACKEGEGICPSEAIRSYQATQFSGCMKEIRHRENNTKTSTVSVNTYPDQLVPGLLTTVVLLMIICELMTFLLLRRHKSGTEKQLEKTHSLVEQKIKETLGKRQLKAKEIVIITDENTDEELLPLMDEGNKKEVKLEKHAYIHTMIQRYTYNRIEEFFERRDNNSVQVITDEVKSDLAKYLTERAIQIYDRNKLEKTPDTSENGDNRINDGDVMILQFCIKA